MAKVNIVVPIYNVEAYLERNLESLRTQTYQDIRVLCVNDGSTDRSLEIASEYAGIEVKHMLFDQLEEVNKYDGIWACAAILHLTLDEIEDVIRKMIIATKNNGIIYISFK